MNHLLVLAKNAKNRNVARAERRAVALAKTAYCKALSAYVVAVRAATFCAHCGKQPIVWHHPDEDGYEGRASDLVTRCATITDIDAEINRCVPLCAKCHLGEHRHVRPTFDKRDEAVLPVELLRFNDLKEAAIVTSRVALGRMINKSGFPPGRLLGQNTRAWTEDEIQTWVDTRPVERPPDAIPREQRFGVNNQAKAVAAKSAKAKIKHSAPKRRARR